MPIVGISYGAVTFVVHCYANAKVYSFLDWRNPGQAILTIAAITGFGTALFLSLAYTTQSFKGSAVTGRSN